MARDIYVMVEGKRVGPLAVEEVRSSVAEGRIPAGALAWREGLAEWGRLEEVVPSVGALVPVVSAATLPISTSGSDASTLAPTVSLSALAAATPDAATSPALVPDASAPATWFASAPTALTSGVPASALVEISHVTKSFGDKVAVRDVTFSVPSGQICGLLGPNGAGKTTLFRLLMGILKATEGSLLVDGLDVFEKRVEAKRLIGFLPDEPIFYSYLSGREVLELSAAMHGLDVKTTMARLDRTILKMRLMEDINNYAEDYSRGMKKKLGLLLALLHQPKLLILDEPTNGLDVESTHLFYELISDEAKQGTTVLFSTHLMDHVTKLCSHAVIISGGSVVTQGSLNELRAAHGPDSSLEEIFLKLTARPGQT